MEYENTFKAHISSYGASTNINELISQQVRNTNRGSATGDILRALHDQFSVEVADTPQAIEEAHRLRYEVYCVEYRYESSDTGLEVDEFDDQSRHIILRHQATGKAVGTVRLVPFGFNAGKYALPIQQICAPGTLDCFPIESAGEISRFAISKELRGLAGASVTPIQVGLMRGIVQASRELGLTHWCAIMERSLLRLLRAAAIHFHPVGSPVAHHGLRQPAYGMIKQVMSRLRSERPDIWNFIDPDGLCSSMQN